MDIDIYAKSVQLLEQIANSIHDEQTNINLFTFNINEIHIVEDWIRELIKELQEKKPVVETQTGFFYLKLIKGVHYKKLQQGNSNMLRDELKECLSECLDCLESALDVLDAVKDYDSELNYWYDEINELYEKIRLKYEK